MQAIMTLKLISEPITLSDGSTITVEEQKDSAMSVGHTLEKFQASFDGQIPDIVYPLSALTFESYRQKCEEAVKAAETAILEKAKAKAEADIKAAVEAASKTKPENKPELKAGDKDVGTKQV